MTEDYTIFAWPGAVKPAGALSRYATTRSLAYSFFASDTSEFRRLEAPSWQYSDLVRIPESEIRAAAPESRYYSTNMTDLEDLDSDDDPPTITGRGLRICLPLMHLEGEEYLAATYFKIKNTGEWLCIPLTRNSNERQRFARNSWHSYGIQLIRINYPEINFKRCTIYGERFDDSPSKMKPRNGLHKRARDLISDKLFEPAMNLVTRLYGPQHPATLDLVSDVVQKYLSQGQYEDAELLGLELLKRSKAALGEEHKSTLRAQLHLATAISKQGQLDAAEEIFHHLVMKYDQIEGEAYNATLICRTRRAENMFNKEQHKGRQYFQKVMDQFEKHIEYRQFDTGSAKEFVISLRSKLDKERYKMLDASDGTLRVDKEGNNILDALAEASKTIRGEEDPGTLLITFCQKLYGSYGRISGISKFALEVRRLLGDGHRLTIAGQAASDLYSWN